MSADDMPAAATVVLARDRNGAEGIEILLLQRPDHGSFARAWVFPGGRVDATDAPNADEDDRARAAAIRETHEETGLRLTDADLAPLAHWTPPPNVPHRFRTWFFLARAPYGAVTLNPDESVGHRWLQPEDALALHAERALTLFPPTWVTLHGLAEIADVDDALSLARSHPPAAYATVHDPVEQRFLWHGDEAYEGAADTDSGPRHRLHTGSLPWRFEHR